MIDPKLDTDENKRLFAMAYARDRENPFQAALKVFPENTGMALYAQNHWVDDPKVEKFLTELDAEYGQLHFLPDKSDLCRELWRLVTKETASADDKLKAMKLYADVRGFIEKQGPVINNNNMVTNNKVMLVKDHGNDTEWENTLVEQQRTLIADANASL